MTAGRSTAGLVRQALLLSLLLGILVATTTTGSLALPWVVEGAFVVFWFVLLQAVAVALVTRLFGVRHDWQTVVSRYWYTHAPWVVLVLLLSIVAVCAPDHQVHRSFWSLGRILWLPVLVGWLVSCTMKAILFHRAFGLSRVRTALVLVTLSGIYLLAPFAFFVATGQLPIAVLRGYL